jgi:hypothetical protein
MASPVTLSAAEHLMAVEQIKATFSTRLRCMDTKQWHVYPTLHTVDVVSETWSRVPSDRRPTTDGVSNRVVGNERLGKTIESFMDGDRRSPRCTTPTHPRSS